MVNGVKVAQNARCAANRAQKEDREVLSLQMEALTAFCQQEQRHGKGNGVSEQALLDAGQVAGQPDENAHPAEAERRADDVKDCFGFWVEIFQGIRLLSDLLYHKKRWIQAFFEVSSCLGDRENASSVVFC